jgi:cytoskeleton protein RodZ
MSIGAELAAARRKAGLTVTEVSQRTRIREAIVRGIERDDFSACGGDFYARGHIRAIARAAGMDPEPLVREYDDARDAVTQETIPVPRTGRPRPAVPAPGRPAAAPGRPATTAAGRPATTAAGRPATTAAGRPATTAAGRSAAAPGGSGTAVRGGPAAAAPGRPAAPAGRIITIGSDHETPSRLGPPPQVPHGAPRVPIWGTVLVALVAAAAGVLVYHAVSSHQAGSPAASRSLPAASRSPAVTPRASATPTATPTPSSTAAASPGTVVIALAVSSEPCWAEITTASGTTVYQGIVPAGTTMTWTESQAVTLTLGNPGSVTLTVNGQARTGLGVNPVTLNLAPGQ